MFSKRVRQIFKLKVCSCLTFPNKQLVVVQKLVSKYIKETYVNSWWIWEFGSFEATDSLQIYKKNIFSSLIFSLGSLGKHSLYLTKHRQGHATNSLELQRGFSVSILKKTSLTNCLWTLIKVHNQSSCFLFHISSGIVHPLLCMPGISPGTSVSCHRPKTSVFGSVAILNCSLARVYACNVVYPLCLCVGL